MRFVHVQRRAHQCHTWGDAPSIHRDESERRLPRRKTVSRVPARQQTPVGRRRLGLSGLGVASETVIDNGGAKLSRSWRTVKRALVSVEVAARARVTHVRDARPDAGHARARVSAARNPVGVDGSPVMFRRKKSVSARAEETPPEDAPSDPADDASLWSDDSMTPERGVLTRGAVRGLPGDGSDGDASPSSRSLLSVDSAASTPSRAHSVSTDRWRRDALEALSARMLNEETREARELAAREARHREEQDRKRAGVLASLPERARVSPPPRGGRKAVFGAERARRRRIVRGRRVGPRRALGFRAARLGRPRGSRGPPRARPA